MTFEHHTSFYSSSSLRIWLALIAILLAGSVAVMARPSLSHVHVALQDETTPHSYSQLPYLKWSTDESNRFIVTALLQNPALSSGRIQVTPDDCLESIEINGIAVPTVTNAKPAWRCHPSLYSIDLSDYLQRGGNKLRMVFSDIGGVYGLNARGQFDLEAIITIVALCSLALYAAWGAILQSLPSDKLSRFHVPLRMTERASCR